MKKKKENTKSKNKIEQQHKNEEQKQTQNPHEQEQKYNLDPIIQPRSKHSHEKKKENTTQIEAFKTQYWEDFSKGLKLERR